MSEQGTTAPIANVDADSTRASLSRLIELAREAYQLKSTKDCLDLTRAILLIDPENAEAQLMRSSMRSEMRLDLETARALLKDAQLKERPERQAAASIFSASEPEHDEEAETPPQDADFDPPSNAPAMLKPVSPQVFTDLFAGVNIERRGWLKNLMSFKRAGTIVVVGLVAVGVPIFRSKSNPVEITAAKPSTAEKPAGTTTTTPPDSGLNVAAAPPADVPDPASTTLTAENRATALFPPTERDSANTFDREFLERTDQRAIRAIASSSGTLAVSSLTSTDIYIEDQYVGSTPVTLQISEGTHTVEYRHAHLRKTMTHVIKGNETTRAMITFDIAMSVNAKPWAYVFLDGVEKKLLGQTPLSNVQIPIGGVLLFENPQFEGKKYRVTGNETGVQIVFP